MAIRGRFRKFYECDTQAEIDLTWGEDTLIYAIDTDKYLKVLNGSIVEVPKEVIHLSLPISLSNIAISGVPDGHKFLRDDGSWAEVASVDAGGSQMGFSKHFLLMGG